MLMLVVSDTSDRAHLGQKPSLARRFVAVSVATITSFSWLLIEIDTNSERAKAKFPLADGLRPRCEPANGRRFCGWFA
jgi:hypothetical protein